MPHGAPPCLFFFLSCCLLLSCRPPAVAGNRGEDDGDDRVLKGSIGAILDLRCRTGKEERIAVEMALDDLHDPFGFKPALHMRDTGLDPKQTASEDKAIRNFNAASRLIDEEKVQAILGLGKWPHAAEVAELGERASVPILSFSHEGPPWASERWPFLLQFTRDRSPQIKAISAIIASWNWRKVAIIYEEDGGYGADSISQFMDAVRAVGSDVDYQLALSPLAPIATELEKLKTRCCRAFVVHTSLPLATRLFAAATEMGMMEKSYAWVTTGAIADHLDSANSSVIASMEGVIGIKTFFPRTSAAYLDLCRKFQTSFAREYPGELIPELSINGLQVYDAVRAVAEAMRGLDAGGNYPSHSHTHRQLLEHIAASNFSGASGKVQFVLGKLAPPEILQVINVVGRSYREMGFWTDELGFSRGVGPRAEHNLSMAILGQVVWPGRTGSAPRGWVPSTGKNPLSVGVPSMAVFRDYVSVDYDKYLNRNHFSGFAIDIFQKAVKYLPYELPYQFIPYNGTYDDMVGEVFHMGFDIVVGDPAILSYRCEFVQFSQPYTQSGITMVVPVKPVHAGKAWIFLKPFTPSLWVSIAAISLINAFTIWLIERRSSPEYQGLSPSQQLGYLMWLAFTTLFPQGERPHHNLSRVVMVVWLFVGLVLTSNYTAILSSMLTVQKLEPAVADVDQLRKTNAVVGCNRGSSVVRFLKEVLGFSADRIKEISTEEGYYEAFRRGEIKASFLGYGHGRVFLAKYCKGFTAAGPTFHSGGFGFVFPKRSLLLPDMTAAILKLFETGEMQEMEDGLLSSYNCSSLPTSGDDSLGVGSFWGLLAIMGVTSMLVLIVFSFTHRGSSRVSPAVLEGDVQREGGDSENHPVEAWEDEKTLDPNMNNC